MIPKLNIRTKEERDALLSLLGDINRRLFKKEGAVKGLVTGDDWNRFSWYPDVKAFFDDLDSRSAAYDTYVEEIKSTQSWLSGLSVVKLDLPFKPSDAFVEEAYRTISGLKPEGFVLEINLDRSVISGGRLFLDGRYIDLTLRSRINNLLSTEDAVNKYL